MKKEYLITQEDHQSRIDIFAYRHQINKKALKGIKMRGDILVNGVHQTVRYLLNEGDILTFVYPSEENHICPEKIPLAIIYEDDYLLVVNKPKGMACIPTRQHPHHTLANALSAYYQEIGLSSTVHLVNRLDKDTTGLMLVAKYRDIHYQMSQNIMHIYRRYHAHVEGKVDQGLIDLPIYRDDFHMKRIIDKRGKPSRTHYRCLHYQNQVSFVECILETGRTHQIRVHMAAIGHPLVGDSLYGSGEGEFDLESVMIAFWHPVTKQCITITKKHKYRHF